MGIFGGMKPPLGGYDQMAAMQGQSGFAPMNQGFTPPAQKKPGFFSKNGGWRDLAGAFGDAFSPNGPAYFPQKQRQNELMQRQQMAEQQRMQEREDFLFKEQYKRSNPMPVNNDTTADYEYIASKLGKDAADNYLRLKTERQQTTIIDNGDGTKTIYQVPQGGGMRGAQPVAPPRPVGKLRPLGGQPGGNVPFVQ